jgi:hypothetical protein
MADKISEVLQQREKWGKNIFTLVFLGILGALAFYYWGLIVPFVLDTVYDTVRLAIACVALVAIGFVVFDPRMRTLWLYGYNSAMRWLTRQFTDIDPIGILQTYVSRLKERLAEMEEAIGSLGGQRDQLAAFIAKNEEERQHELQRARSAKKIVDGGGENAADMRGQLALHGRQAGRLEASNKTLQALLARMDKLLIALKKLRDTSNVLVQDIENEVKVQTEQYKMITKGFAAFKRAQKMMATGGPEKELFDETLNRLADSYNEKMGQIEYFMEVSKSMINGADLDNMAYEESALAQLEKWDKDGAGLSVPPVGGNGNGPRIDTQPASKVRVAAEDPEGFGSLFEDDNQGKAQK